MSPRENDSNEEPFAGGEPVLIGFAADLNTQLPRLCESDCELGHKLVTYGFSMRPTSPIVSPCYKYKYMNLPPGRQACAK